MWCMCLGVYLLRFITLGTKINKKYRNFSVLITEQVPLICYISTASSSAIIGSIYSSHVTEIASSIEMLIVT